MLAVLSFVFLLQMAQKLQERESAERESVERANRGDSGAVTIQLVTERDLHKQIGRTHFFDLANFGQVGDSADVQTNHQQ